MTQLFQALLLFTLAVTLGCAPKVIKMDATTKGLLSKTQQIIAIHYVHPVFELPARSNYAGGGGVVEGAVIGAITGVVSGITTRSRGERIEEKFGLYDPILDVEGEFISAVHNEFPSLKVSAVLAPFESDDIDDLKGQFSQGYILDFQTRRWGIVQHAEGWEYLKPPGFRERRKVTFAARARLIDPSQKSILWQGICDVEDLNNIFTMEDVENWHDGKNNNLENLFNILTSMCLKELREQFLQAQAPAY